MVEGVRFDFEDLEVYKRALIFVDKMFDICEKFSYHFQSSLGDQLRRASLSIVNNIAEGSDKISSREKKRYFMYSLDSARECIPMLAICKSRRLIKEEVENVLREDCKIICRMLNKLIKSIK